MNLKQLEYFVRVAHAGSFTKASTRLRVAQSALSKHVRRLEIDLKHEWLIAGRIVQQGHGHAILPASSVSLSNLSGQLQLNEIVQPRLARALNLAIASKRPMTQAVRESIKLIRLHLGDGADVSGP